MRWFQIFALAAFGTLFGCDDDPPAVRWRDLGALPVPATTSLSHTPLLIAGSHAFVGTSDGVWRRPLAAEGEWTRAGLEGIAIFATRRHPTVESTLFAAGQPAADLFAAPFWRSDDGGATWIPAATFPRNSFDGSTEPFLDIAVAPDGPDRLYANLWGTSIAVSTDGGMNWALANGETEVSFGDACAIHVRADAPGTLYQGCEAPLDTAWVATLDIDPANPLVLSNFTFVAGGPDFALENRRPNAMASGPARPGTLYVGLEGAMIALDDDGFEFVFRAEEGGAGLPYVYVGAIWPDPEDPDRILFGGDVNGTDEALGLFETRDHGASLRQLTPPGTIYDPALEQVAAAGDGLAVLVSEAEDIEGLVRSLRLWVIE